MQTLILHLALPRPLRRCFDYLLPDNTDPGRLTAGMRVRVPFGSKELIGVLLSVDHHSDIPLNKLKPALEVLDERPVLNQEDLALAEFAARYYHHPLGEVMSQMLPISLRQGKPALLKPLRKKKSKEILPDTPEILNQEQALAYEHILERLLAYHVTLLQGVTGSGKTEVYLQIIDQVIKQGKQILVLVPEIGLTPQTLERFQARFPDVHLGLLHSNIAQGTRLQTWLRAQTGEYTIVIGTRSAVFTPMPNLGLIVIDEEHDLSFKQQEGFRYHARDLAIWRAHQKNIPVILGSATPSLETLHNVHQHKYFIEHLTQRVQAQSPRIHVIDLKNQNMPGGLSAPLLKAIEKRLAQQEQVLLFLNRRGYAPTWMCHTCGWVADCPRCDARLTYHQNGRLICHHCEYQIARLSRCKSCGSESNLLLGEGTQRLEEVLQQQFPDAAIIRIDRDSTRKKEALTTIIDDINQRKFHILLGTQMLAKGHHFPYVTLVAVIDADAGLLSADFRSQERMAQLLTQVAGRAGREQLPGEVFIQTHHPEHPLLQQLLNEGYESFTQSALQERASMQLPPHGHLALLRAESVKSHSPMEFLQQVRTFLKPLTQIRCLGPVPAMMEKRQGKFRAQLLICAPQRPFLQQALTQLIQALESHLQPKQVRWSLDVDPQEMS